MKKAIGAIHLWLGMISGLVVFIISITGCIYVFEKELKTWLYASRETIAVPGQATKKTVAELLEVAQRAAGKDHRIQTITVSAIPDQTYSFRPEQIRNAKAFTHFGEIVYNHRFYLNPYTGEVVKNENTAYEFFTVVLRLHRNLLINRSVGKMIIGISTIIFVVMLLSGIVLWWPKNKSAARQRVWFRWKDSTKLKRKNYDLHNILGFYSLFVLMVIALTGLVFSFTWFENSIQWIANRGAATLKPKTLFSDTTQVDSLMPIDKILFKVAALHPGAHAFTINLPDKAGDVVRVTIQSTEHIRYNRKQYQFDQYTGIQLQASGFDALNTGEKLSAMNYDIHVGSILGFPGKVLAFFASLIAATLPVTGFAVWWGRKKKKSKRRNPGKPAGTSRQTLTLGVNENDKRS